MTERILVWFRTDNIHLTWSEWENNPHFMGPTPHQTTSRLVTSRRTIRRANIIRRGIACEFEHDFVRTAFGRSKFMSSLQQMARSLQETANVLDFRALLDCHRNQHQFGRDHHVPALADLDSYHERDINRFMTVQKDVNGLTLLNTEIDGEMEMWSSEADTWLLDRRVFDYASQVPPENTQYWLGGQQAVDTLNGIRGGNAAANTMGNVKNLVPPRFVGNSTVLLAKSLYQEMQGKVELLSRQREIGIYNLMVDRTRDYREYSSASRNLKVYDNQNDNWAEIEFQTALAHCVAFNKDNTLINPFNNGGKLRGTAGHGGDAQDEQDWLSFATSATNSKERADLEYIGDMSSNFLETRHLMHGAQTLFNVITGGRKDVESRLDALATIVLGGQTTDSTLGRVDPTEEIVLKNLVGANNLLFKGGATLEERFRQPIKNNGVAATESRIGGDASRVAVDNSEASHRAFLLNLLGAAVPDAHKGTLESIVARTQDTWSDRARAVKELVLHIQRETPDAIEMLPDAARVDKWYSKLYQQYDTKVKEAAATTAAAASSIGGNAGTGSLHSVRLGAPIPAGWKAVPTGKTLFDVIGCHAQAPGAAGTTREDRMAMRKADVSGGGSTGLTPHPNLLKHVNAILASVSSATMKLLAIAYACIEFRLDRMMEMANNHLFVPIGLALLRLHATYKTLTGIKVASGGKAGYTVVGHSDVQIQHDATRKVGVAHYTTYLSAVVTNPKMVYIVQDMFCERYCGGMDVTFWKSGAEYKNSHNRRAKSILVIPLPPNVKKFEKKIDVRGRWITEYQLGLVSDDRYELPLYPGAARMNALCGWSDANRKDMQSKRTGGAARNFCAWQGHEWYFNTRNGTWDDWTPEQGEENFDCFFLSGS